MHVTLALGQGGSCLALRSQTATGQMNLEAVHTSKFAQQCITICNSQLTVRDTQHNGNMDH